MLLLKLGFLILFLSMAAPFSACKTNCLAGRGVLYRKMRPLEASFFFFFLKLEKLHVTSELAFSP